MITNLTQLRVFHGYPLAVKGKEIPDIEYEDGEDEYAEEMSIRDEVPLETQYITIRERTTKQQKISEEQPYVEDKEQRLEPPDHEPPDPGLPDPDELGLHLEPPDPEELGEGGTGQEGMELTQEGTGFICKHDRFSSVELGNRMAVREILNHHRRTPRLEGKPGKWLSTWR